MLCFFYSTIPRFDTGRINEAFVQDDGDLNPRSSFNPLSNVSLDSSDNIKFSRPVVEHSTPLKSEFNRANDIPFSRQHTSLNDLKFNTSEPPQFERVAKIGKYYGGRRTPPQNVSIPRVPYIPSPDYTPPSTPNNQPKSALRSQSKYLY